MENKRKTGSFYERFAAEYLTRCGLRILERNFRTRYGEIDLIADDGGTLVFVEVKYKRTPSDGYALEMVHPGKQYQVTRIARQYLYSHHIPESRPVRFDCIGITGSEIRYIRNAFEA